MNRKGVHILIAVLLIILFLSVSLAISIFNTPNLDTGVVIAKTYEPARTITQFIHKDGHMYTVPHYYPAEWKIQVQGSNDDNERITEWWSVDETTYHKVTVGNTVQRNQ